MLRRLDVRVPWRSLDSGFWPEDLPAGCKTVIYGHNGSGKSTVSELLLSLAEGSSATAVVWEDQGKQRTYVATGGTSPSPDMAVFTRKWVEENLSAFLDGASASAIVTLGREAIDAKDDSKSAMASSRSTSAVPSAPPDSAEAQYSSTSAASSGARGEPSR